MLRRLLTAFTLTAIALAASAQSRFVIDRIEVRNARRVSPRVVIDETLLREGNEYSDEDVRLAVARLKRLPFLLTADYALENRVLVITVTEVNRFSIRLDARGILLDELGGTFDYDYDRPTESNDALDLRWFVGGRGMAHFAMQVNRPRQEVRSRYTAFETGYTGYDLFGTRVFATFNLRAPVDSYSEGWIRPELIVGYPLTSTQTVTADFEETYFFKRRVRILNQELDRLHAERVITLAWTYDTTDEPLLPTQGTFVRVAPMRVMSDRSSARSVPRNPPFESLATHQSANAVDFAALHTWRLSDVHSLSAGVFAGWADVENRSNPPSPSAGQPLEPHYQILQAGYSRGLRGRSRLGIEGRAVFRQNTASKDVAGVHDATGLEAEANWVHRSAWGTLRLGIAYQQIASD